MQNLRPLESRFAFLKDLQVIPMHVKVYEALYYPTDTLYKTLQTERGGIIVRILQMGNYDVER